MTMVQAGSGYLDRPRSSSLADVVAMILDKGLVIDIYVRVSLVGIELITIDARIVIASVDTYLRFAEATNRLDLTQQGGKPLPGIAPFAMQSGTHAARSILDLIAGRSTKTFHYWDKGSMATIGRNKAVADLKVVKLSGFLAWLSWLLIHLLFIVELRNKILNFFRWVWGYITYTHGARLSYQRFQPVVPPKDPRPSANEII